ncbi:hypothetical protein K449DRAFT_384826 [Hypoxylon sp. EC38]|nr:hypothetical protein K449DRAFT_384826 [Hypoxylon sp. EC38]
MDRNHHNHNSRHRRHHYRSKSAAPAPVPSEPKHCWHGTVTQSIGRPNDLESITYREAQQRRNAKALRDEWSVSSDNVAKGALHYKPFRDNPYLRGFLDAARSYDQELLYLQFHLGGPNKIHFLPREDTEKAIASLHRARSTLSSAGWRVKRCVDLLNVHASCKATGDVVWSEALERAVDTGKLELEIKYHNFWMMTRPRFKPLLEELWIEIPRMRRIIRQLDRNRDPLFMRQVKEDACSAVPRASNRQGGLGLTTTTSGSRLNEMSSVLRSSKTKKSPTCVNNLGTKLEVSSAAAASQIRYGAIRAREKFRGPDKPEASKATWAAFRENLDNQTGPPSSGRIILRHKVETRLLLAERRIERLEAQIRAGCQEGGGVRTRDVGTQTD